MKFIYDRVMNGSETAVDPLYFNKNSYGTLKVKDNCNLCEKCVKECLVKAISKEKGKIIIDSKKCIYCGNCINACEIGSIENSHDYKMACIETEGDKLREKIYKKFKRSLMLRSFDAGSCNACMMELSAMSNTYYSLSRFGIDFASSPRHSDGIVVTGPVTINMKEALIKTYNAMPYPKIVIAIGACAHDGGVFKESYGTVNLLNEIVPVDLTIQGCPPSPQAMIYGMLKLMGRI